MRATFDADYPEQDFRDINIDIEYPMTQSSYPGLWVTYEDTDELTVAGVGHREFIEPAPGAFQEVSRWKFGGTVTVTCVALTSLERDRLFDEVVRTFAFGRENQAVSAFRDKVESNDLIAMNVNFDNLRPSGESAAMGTPWQTDDVIYEKSLSMDLIGEFIGDPSTQSMVPLSNVHYVAHPNGDANSPFPVDLPDEEFQSTNWH